MARPRRPPAPDEDAARKERERELARLRVRRHREKRRQATVVDRRRSAAVPRQDLDELREALLDIDALPAWNDEDPAAILVAALREIRRRLA